MGKNIKIESVTKYIIRVNIIIIAIYVIGWVILINCDLLWRGWINTLFVGSIFFLIIIVRISINMVLWSETDSNVLKGISTMITGIVIIICCVVGTFMVGFWYEPEHIVYKENQKLVAKVCHQGFHHMKVEFYEPKTIFFMKKSNVKSELYDGSYDRYEKR